MAMLNNQRVFILAPNPNPACSHDPILCPRLNADTFGKNLRQMNDLWLFLVDGFIDGKFPSPK